MSWDGFASGAAQATGAAYSAIQSEKAVRKILEYQKQAHQYEVADLKAAGLNPILSTGGNGTDFGAPTPDTSGWQQAGSALGAGMQLDNDIQRVKNETQQTGADVNLKEEAALKTAAETLTEGVKRGLLTEQQANTAMETALKEKQIEQIQNNINISRKQYELAEKQYENDRKRLEVEIYKARVSGRLQEAQAKEQELRNKDYNFYKYRDTIFGVWDRLNESVDSFRNKKPQPKQERKERKETWIKKNGEWVNSALIIGSKFI